MTIKEVKDILVSRKVLKDTPKGIWVACSIREHIDALCRENSDFEQKYKSYSSYEEFFVCLKNQVDDVPKCPYCGENVSVSHRKFRDTCGKRSCYQRDHERVMTEKYGVPFTWKVKSVQEKTKQTFQDRWGVDNAGQSKEIHDKSKRTCLEKYGVEYSVMIPEVREYIKKHNQEIANNPELQKEITFKRYNTMIEKYGYAHALQCPELLEKASNTMKERLGCNWAQQSVEVKNKGIKTRLEKYGVEYCAQSEEYAKNINRKYLYNDDTFDSSWEVAFLIYSTEVLHKDIIHNFTPITLKYSNGKEFKYFPDFFDRDTNEYIEVKGNQFLDENRNLIPCFKRETEEEEIKFQEKCKAKDKFIKENGYMISKEEITPMLEYVKNTKGSNFFKSILVE